MAEGQGKGGVCGSCHGGKALGCRTGGASVDVGPSAMVVGRRWANRCRSSALTGGFGVLFAAGTAAFVG